MKRRQALGQLGERPQVSKLLRRERGRVDGKPREVSREDRSHFFCNVKRDRHLRLRRRGADVRRGHEIGQGQQRIFAGRLLLEHVSCRRGQPA